MRAVSTLDTRLIRALRRRKSDQRIRHRGGWLKPLPVVTYPDQPPAGAFVYKLPGGQPLRANASIQGTLLAKGDEKTLEVTLPHDLFVYKRWVSEDRQNWVYWSQMMDIRIGIAMPSDEYPKDGEMRLVLNRK